MSATRLFNITLLCALAAHAQAQTTAPVAPATAGATVPFSAPDTVIDAAMRHAAIEEMATDLVDNYVFPDVARAMAADLRRREKNGEYAQLTSAVAFAQKMQEHLLAICHDKHVRVRYREPRPAEARQAPATAPADGLDRNTRFGRMTNYGFAKFEQLEGNIAYLELRNFQDAKSGAQTVAAAMGMAAHAEALIIDLRRNGGGSPAMVALITSYLYGKERVHLNDLYWRKDDRTESFWTDPDVPGLRFGPDKPVYVLTSERTFSAAEEFSYNLKHLKRATLVGETTGGGANPGGGFSTGAHWESFIPTGRAINPITKTNWEGTGVTPHVATTADQALATAHLLALKPLLATAAPEVRSRLQAKADELQAAASKAAPARQGQP